MGKKGLWANMHAKRKRGEAPAKPGDKDYPTEKALKDSAAKMKSPFKMKPSPSALKCWKGYKRKPGTKEFSEGSCVKK